LAFPAPAVLRGISVGKPIPFAFGQKGRRFPVARWLSVFWLRQFFGWLQFEVSERQGCSRLECLDGNVAAHLAHDRQIEQFAHKKALVFPKVSHDNFKEIVRLAGDEMACNNLWHRNDRFLELKRALVGVPVDLDADEDLEAEPDAVTSQGRPITLNVPVALQTLDTTQARRWRQADLVGELDIAQPAVGLQLGHNATVDRIKF
jgi:hypothetical protein